MSSYKYFLGIIICGVWLWYFFEYFHPELKSIIRVLIVCDIILYIDLGVRYSLKKTKLKKLEDFSDNYIPPLSFILFNRRIKIQWIYHFFTSLVILVIARVEYQINWQDQRFYIILFLAAIGIVLMELLIYSFGRAGIKNNVS